VREVGVGADADIGAGASHWTPQMEAIRLITCSQSEGVRRSVTATMSICDVEEATGVEQDDLISCEGVSRGEEANEGVPLADISQGTSGDTQW
jgi:hypothetical protein